MGDDGDGGREPPQPSAGEGGKQSEPSATTGRNVKWPLWRPLQPSLKGQPHSSERPDLITQEPNEQTLREAQCMAVAHLRSHGPFSLGIMFRIRRQAQQALSCVEACIMSRTGKSGGYKVKYCLSRARERGMKEMPEQAHL